MDPPYDINLVFVLKITIVLRKIKKAATKAALFDSSRGLCTKSFFGSGFAPDPTGKAYSTPPAPTAVFGAYF